MKVCLACGNKFSSPGWQCPACGVVPEKIGGYYSFAPELAKSNEFFSEELFKPLAELEQGHFWFETRNRIIIWGLQKYFPAAKTFMEIGCGTGFVVSAVSRTLPHLKISASEIFAHGLEFAERRCPGISLFQMDARAIPFDSAFDVIGAFDVIEHIEDDDLVLRNIWRAVKPGGGVLLTVPQHRFLWSAQDERAFHKRRYSSSELCRKLRQAGFTVLHITSFVSLLFPFMLISRLRKGKQAHKTYVEEVTIPPVLNRLFSAASAWEEKLTTRGFSLPFGGSLFVVASKPE